MGPSRRYGADAVTVNPYLGGDSVAPFTKYAGAAPSCSAAASSPAVPTCRNN